MRTWELETVTFGKVLNRATVRVSSSERANTVLDVPEDEHCFIRVSLSDGNVSWGEFELWYSGSRAIARILEHREHDARDPDAHIGEEHVVFRSEDGSPFTVTIGKTVQREKAVNALQAWIRDQEYSVWLVWS